jgi:hypothetical protein
LGYGEFVLRRLRASLTYANVMSTVAVVAALTGGAYAVAAIPDAGGKVNACYFKSGKKKGQVRLLVSGTKCRKGETKLSWNQQGPQGAQGLQGLAGQQGDRGLAGSDAQLPPVEALREVAPAPATANCGPSNPATAVFCALGANGWQWQNSAAGGPPVAFFKDRSSTGLPPERDALLRRPRRRWPLRIGANPRALQLRHDPGGRAHQQSDERQRRLRVARRDRLPRRAVVASGAAAQAGRPAHSRGGRTPPGGPRGRAFAAPLAQRHVARHIAVDVVERSGVGPAVVHLGHLHIP